MIRKRRRRSKDPVATLALRNAALLLEPGTYNTQKRRRKMCSRPTLLPPRRLYVYTSDVLESKSLLVVLEAGRYSWLYFI